MKEKEFKPQELTLLGLIGGGQCISDTMREQAQTEFENSSDGLCRTEQVPKGDQEDLKAMGLKIIGPVENDPLFLNVQFPHGWTKKRTNHGMYTDILDEKGRKRGTIMYKPDFWDRDGRTYSTNRFIATYNSPRWEDQSAEKVIIPIVKNSNDEIVWRGEPLEDDNGWRAGDCPYESDAPRNGDRYYYDCSEHARFLSYKVLLSVCPDYGNKELRGCTLYWDTEPVWPASLSEPPKGELYSVYVEFFTQNYYGGFTHVDSGHNCSIRAESDKEALEKAEKATKHFQGSYDRFVLRVIREGKEVGSRNFEKTIRPQKWVFDEYERGYGYRNG